MRKGVLFGAAIILGMLGGTRVCGREVAREARRARGEELRRLLRAVDGSDKEPARTFRTPDGYVRFLSAPPAARFRATAGTAEEQAAAFLATWRNIFVNQSAAIAFEQKRIKTANGRSYIRYRQRYTGLEVFGAEMIVQVGSGGGIEAVISDIMRDTETLDTEEGSINPTIDAPTARQNAINFLTTQYERLQFEATPAELMIYSPVVVGNSGQPRLVWRTEVCNLGEPLARELILVDAHTGEIAFHYSLIYASLSRQITDCKNTSSTADDVVYPEQRNNWPYDPPETVEVELAYDYLEDTYWFYLDHHGRENYNDNPNTTLQASVRDSSATAGAYWNPITKTIHVQTNSVTDDTFGHEFTHGVIETDSQLGSSGEAGAIRESLCDMWGEWIDLENEKDRYGDDDDPADRWELWEDDLNVPIPLQRNMKNPPVHNCGSWWSCDRQHPDYYERPGYWYPVEQTSPDHFIYHNCGVGNKLCYLLTDGDTFRTYTITGMGITKAAALFYECQCYLLTSSADYHDLANVLLLAATNLRMTAEEQADVENASRAVAIYSDNSVFSIQDSSGARVAWFDDVGNLFLAGRVFEEGQEVGIEARWKMDDNEDNSNVIDSTEGPNNGTYHGTGGEDNYTSSHHAAGEIDGALEFDGTQDYVSLGSPVAALEGDTVTVSAWIKPDYTGGSYDPIVTQYEHDTYYGYDLCLIAGKPSFCLLDNAFAQAYDAISSDWHHLAGTCDGQELRIYADGVLKDSTGYPGYTGTEAAAYIGRGHGFQEDGYFGGRIDDVRVYDYVLSRKEVRNLPYPDESVFRIQNSSGETVAWFNASGYLFLEGSVQENYQGSPSAENDNFVITDGSDVPVAWIDDSGNLYLAGELYE